MKSILLVLWSSFVLCSCDSPNDQQLTDAVNCFTLNFYRLMGKGKDNLISSPFSVDILLSILRAGAGGQTAQALDQALGYLGFQASDVQDAFKSQLSKLVSGVGSTLYVADAIWIDERLPVSDTFKEIAVNKFYSDIRNVDFKNNAHQVTDEINQWANEETRGLITKLFDEDLDPQTVMVLANAIYFNGTWKEQFATNDTRDGQFFNNGDLNNSSTVLFMNQIITTGYKYDEALGAKILEKEYVGGNISMIFILPNSGVNILDFEESLTCKSFKQGTASVEDTFLRVSIPKFEISSEFNLKQPITDDGMGIIFTDSADFSGISNVPLEVSEAIQKSVVRVFEAGSEAAVVTGAAVTITAVPSINFIAQSPFIFLILDKRTGLILFIGRVSQLPSIA